MHGLIPVPKLVDHEEKRREIAAGAAEAIAEMGIDQVTMVDIAQAAGCTTGCVTHYFDNKDEILLAALRYVDESMTDRGYEALDHNEEIASLLLGLLPTTKQQRREWLVWNAFALRAAYQPEMASEFDRRYEQWNQAAALLFERAQERRQLPASFDPASESDGLVAFLDGLGSWAAVAPHRSPRARLEEQINRYLDRLCNPAHTAPAMRPAPADVASLGRPAT